MVKQCAILFGCLALGDFIVWLTGIKLPGSIIGMLLLTAFLQLGWVKLKILFRSTRCGADVVL